jgi:hypothetical protein
MGDTKNSAGVGMVDTGGAGSSFTLNSKRGSWGPKGFLAPKGSIEKPRLFGLLARLSVVRLAS